MALGSSHSQGSHSYRSPLFTDHASNRYGGGKFNDEWGIDECLAFTTTFASTNAANNGTFCNIMNYGPLNSGSMGSPSCWCQFYSDDGPQTVAGAAEENAGYCSCNTGNVQREPEAPVATVTVDEKVELGMSNPEPENGVSFEDILAMASYAHNLVQVSRFVSCGLVEKAHSVYACAPHVFIGLAREH
jgi:hypothetical protein